MCLHTILHPVAASISFRILVIVGIVGVLIVLVVVAIALLVVCDCLHLVPRPFLSLAPSLLTYTGGCADVCTCVCVDVYVV